MVQGVPLIPEPGMILGTFHESNPKSTEPNFAGQIRTLTLDLREVYIERRVLQSDDSERAPDYTIRAGTVKCGSGWIQEKDGTAYVSCRLDDPSFAAPVDAVLFPSKANDGTFLLYWNRKRKNLL